MVSVQHFAEFGVVMMLFLVGLELEPKMLWSMRARLLGLGGGQVVLTALAVMGIATAFGLSWTVALTVGMILALSSTAIVLQTLNEKGLMRSDGGQSSFSVLLMQDIAVIPMLAFIPLLAMPELVEALHQGASAEAGGHGGSFSLVDGLNGWQTALVTLGAIGVVVVGGSYLVSPIFRFIAAAQLRELFTAGALLLVLQDRVGGRELLELVLRVRGFVHVRMQLPSLLLVRGLDLGLRGPTRDPEDLVQVLFFERSHPTYGLPTHRRQPAV